METLHPKEEQRLEKGIIYAKRNTLLAELKALENTLPPIEGGGSDTPWWIANWKWLLIGGLLAIGTSSMLYKALSTDTVTPTPAPPTTLPSKALFAEYFEPFDDVVTDLGKEIQGERRAFEAYNSKDYIAAIPLLENWYSQAQHPNPMAYFYIGISYLAINESDKAITNLEIFKQEAGDFYNDANWYLALAYLSKNETAKVRLLSEELEGSRKREINEILNQLEAKE